MVNHRGLDVVRFPHFCIQLARKTAPKLLEKEDGALGAAATVLTPKKYVETFSYGGTVAGYTWLQ
jgi:hypothetical protein